MVLNVVKSISANQLIFLLNKIPMLKADIVSRKFVGHSGYTW